MKKLICSTLLMLASSVCFALPVGNPQDPFLLREGVLIDGPGTDYLYNDCCYLEWDSLSLRLEYYGDFVFDRDLKFHNGDNIQHSSFYTNAGVLILNFCDWIDFYGGVGGTEAIIVHKLFDLKSSIETDTGTSWLVGLKMNLLDCYGYSFGFDLKYFRTSPELKRIALGGLFSVYPEHMQLKYSESQFAICLAKQIAVFIPYIAMKWSDADVRFDEAVITIPGAFTTTLRNLENRNHWGYAIGVTLAGFGKVSFNTEAQFRDEKAVSINAQLRF